MMNCVHACMPACLPVCLLPATAMQDGYGAAGFQQWGVPPHSTLLFEIELLEVQPKPPLRYVSSLLATAASDASHRDAASLCPVHRLPVDRVAMVGWFGGWKVIGTACFMMVLALLWQADLQSVNS